MRILLLILMLINWHMSAQFSNERIISQEAQWPITIYPGDIDGDGDLDIAAVTNKDKSLRWYENLDGMGSFSDGILINTNESYMHTVHLEDMDNDGDLDLLNTETDSNIISWYENTNGLGEFGQKKFISDNTPEAFDVHPADFDDDGDMDVVVSYGMRVAWYENIDGQGNFAFHSFLTTNTVYSYYVDVTDFDGDGDLDVVSASGQQSLIHWFENLDGKGTFGASRIITDQFFSVFMVHAADIDGDGDMDVVGSSLDEDKIAWFENVDSQGNFGEIQVISTLTDLATSVYTSDLDGDGDLDVLSSSDQDLKIAWYENEDGNGNFGPQRVVSTNFPTTRFVTTADIDNDGKPDIVATSPVQDKIAWFRNNLQPSDPDISDSEPENLYVVFPVPSFDSVFVTSSEAIVKIEIFDILGQLVLQNENTSEIDLSPISDGVYYLKSVDQKANEKLTRIVKHSQRFK